MNARLSRIDLARMKQADITNTMGLLRQAKREDLANKIQERNFQFQTDKETFDQSMATEDRDRRRQDQERQGRLDEFNADQKMLAIDREQRRYDEEKPLREARIGQAQAQTGYYTNRANLVGKDTSYTTRDIIDPATGQKTTMILDTKTGTLKPAAGGRVSLVSPTKPMTDAEYRASLGAGASASRNIKKTKTATHADTLLVNESKRAEEAMSRQRMTQELGRMEQFSPAEKLPDGTTGRSKSGTVFEVKNGKWYIVK
jgi:hypothetical protein